MNEIKELLKSNSANLSSELNYLVSALAIYSANLLKVAGIEPTLENRILTKKSLMQMPNYELMQLLNATKKELQGLI